MKRPNQYIGKAIFGLFILALLMPLAQYKFGYFEERELDGQFDNTVYNLPKLTIKSYFKETYQTELGKFWKANLGFKNSLVRINNEANFRLYDRTSASDVIIGKNNIIFPESYITSYLGKDFIGEEYIENFLTLAKEVQDSLTARDKFFFILIAPGKASVNQESIPESYFEEGYGEFSNYDVFAPLAESKGVHVLDLRKHILNSKEKFDYPIFPQYGLHWSGYTISMIADTFLTYIEAGSGRDLPEVQLGEGTVTVTDYRWTDYDMGEAMNLWWHATDQSLAYPSMEFRKMPESKPAILGVGDSFLQSFYGFYPILDSAFNSDSQLWYYNKIVDWPLKYQPLYMKPGWLSWSKELNETDIVVVEMTEENIRQLGYGFVEDLSDFVNNRLPKKEDNPVLYEELKKDAELTALAENLHGLIGYSKEELLDQLVLNRMKNDWLINFDFDREVELIKQSIYANEEWLKNVKEKAIRNNISLKEQIQIDAVWVVNEELAKN